MIEFDNRKKAKQVAEYLTGDNLRKYIADKVKKYVGDSPTVFDGACGSGQLYKYLTPKAITAVDTQKGACDALKTNYPYANVYNKSFFDYEYVGEPVDCVIMNPPFSIKLKNLSDREHENVQRDFPWKINGNVDDIFILKSLQYTKRFGVYITFAGVGYRNTEAKFRELIGNQLVELCHVENGFEHTTIPVIVLVIDKDKISPELHCESYDCKKQVINYSYDSIIEPVWQVYDPNKNDNKHINIDELNDELLKVSLRNLNSTMELMVLQNMLDGDNELEKYLDYVIALALRYKRNIKTGANR